MAAHWTQQEVVKYRSWKYRIRMNLRLSKLVFSGRRSLNTALEALIYQALSDGVALKHDRTTSVVRVEHAGKLLVLKRYNARTIGHAFSRALRRSRASRCWHMSYAFAEAGLNVAIPVLMSERRFGPLRLTAYFANEFLHGDELLHVLPEMSEEQQLQVFKQVSAAFELMRAAKLTHGDLKASNIIWQAGKLYFIDLDAAQQHRTAMSWNASHHKDRVRFLKNWRDYPALLELFSKLPI